MPITSDDTTELPDEGFSTMVSSEETTIAVVPLPSSTDILATKSPVIGLETESFESANKPLVMEADLESHSSSTTPLVTEDDKESLCTASKPLVMKEDPESFLSSTKPLVMEEDSESLSSSTKLLVTEDDSESLSSATKHLVTDEDLESLSSVTKPLVIEADIESLTSNPSDEAMDKLLSGQDEGAMQKLCVEQDSVEEVTDTGVSVSINPPDRQSEIPMEPPDGGWGWFVLLGACVIAILLPMVNECFSLLFMPVLKSLGTSSTTNTVVFSLCLFILNFCGSFSSTLKDEFGCRRVAMFGCFLVSIAIMVASFTMHSIFLYMYALLAGLGSGLATWMTFLIITIYFKKRRGLAMGTVMSSVALGQIIGPYSISFLQNQYDFRGSTLIIGAVLLNGIAAASLYRPLKKKRKKSKYEKDMNLTNQSYASKNSYVSLNNEENLCTKNLNYLNTNSYVSLNNEENICTTKELSQNKINVFHRIYKSLRSSLQILHHYRAVIIGLVNSLTINGYSIFLMHVPIYMDKEGYSKESRAHIIAVYGFCSLISRLIISMISDYKWFNKCYVYILGNVIIALSILVFTILKEVNYLIVAIGCFGIGVGIFMSLFILVMIEIMPENYGKTLSASCFAIAVGYSFIGPIIGLICDANYVIGLQSLGLVVFIGLMFWLLISKAAKRDLKKFGQMHQLAHI